MKKKADYFKRFKEAVEECNEEFNVNLTVRREGDLCCLHSHGGTCVGSGDITKKRGFDHLIKYLNEERRFHGEPVHDGTFTRSELINVLNEAVTALEGFYGSEAEDSETFRMIRDFEEKATCADMVEDEDAE